MKETLFQRNQRVSNELDNIWEDLTGAAQFMIETTDFNNLAEVFDGLKPEDINRLADEFFKYIA